MTAKGSGPFRIAPRTGSQYDAAMGSLSTRSQVHLRFFGAIVTGLIASIATSTVVDLATSIVAGWGIFALVNVLWGLLLTWPMNAERTRAHAVAEDPGRSLADSISVVGSLVSLVAVGLVIGDSQNAHDPKNQYLLAGISVLSVATSWALIQFNYVLRYARVYYAPTPDSGSPVSAAPQAKAEQVPSAEMVAGGIEFNQPEPPEYTDFIYFAVGLGMTYQVADTNVTSNRVRRIVIGHTMLAFLFATVILATIVNLVTSIGT